MTRGVQLRIQRQDWKIGRVYAPLKEIVRKLVTSIRGSIIAGERIMTAIIVNM